MLADELITASLRSIASLAPAVSGLDRLETELADIDRAAARGYFTPDEDERVRARFAAYLAARAGLLQTIAELKPIALADDGDCDRLDERTRLRAFVAAYTATAILVRAGRYIVERFASNSIVQRKLNEAEPRFGIPRKQFTSVYQSLSSPINAWRIHEAMLTADANRGAIEALCDDEAMAIVLAHLAEAESALAFSTSRYFKSHLGYRWHSLRRRRASAMGQVMFGIFEMAGRVIAEMHNPWHAKRVTAAVQEQLAQLLQPGDVMISRHDDAASNFFLPGYWVHASLHIGTAADRERLCVQLDSDRCARWVDPVRVLEAKKDGVRFRPLSETLAVDAVAVLRPQLDRRQLADSLSRGVLHEGKLYDFEFDFFRSDRLVCTEVVYRSFHGVGGIEFQLSQRAGRPTLAAEDLLAMALGGQGFEPVAVFGAPERERDLLIGPDARHALASSQNQREHA